MNRESARPIVIALLCVLAIGLAAATLNTAVDTEAGGSGLGSGDGGYGVGNQSDPSVGLDRDNESRFDISIGDIPFPVFCLTILHEPWVNAAIVGAFLVGAALAYRKAGIFGSIALLGGLGLPSIFIYVLLSTCERPTGDEWNLDLPNATQLPAGGSGGGDPGSTLAPTPPSIILTILLALTLVVALVLLVKSTEGDTMETDEVSEPEPEPDVQIAAVGRAAGEAADRIEAEGDLDNEVYRTWREMTAHLAVERPESSTPAEFAVAAVDAGMDRLDVGELTTLFEEVRYGDRPPTAEREERAVDALRRIETEYAEER